MGQRFRNHIRRLFPPLLIAALGVTLSSCNGAPAPATEKTAEAKTTPFPATTISETDGAEGSFQAATQEDPGQEALGQEYGQYYVVRVDVGRDFYALEQEAIHVAKVLRLRYDQLGRLYDHKRGIIEPDDSEDDIYRGEYYPRRPFYDTNFVSVEMYNAFLPKNAKIVESDTRMAVVAGIFPDKREANALLRKIKPEFPGAEVYPVSIYLGCMH